MDLNNITINGLNDDSNDYPIIKLYYSNACLNTLFMVIDGYIDDKRAIDLLVRFQKIDTSKWRRLYIIPYVNYMNPMGVIPFTYLRNRVQSHDGGIILISESNKISSIFELTVNNILVPFKCFRKENEYLIISEPVRNQIIWIQGMDHAEIRERIKEIDINIKKSAEQSLPP